MPRKPSTEHRLTITRSQRGMTPIRPSRPVYRTNARCTCGWTGKNNRAPSLGGTSAVRSLHEHETGVWPSLAGN